MQNIFEVTVHTGGREATAMQIGGSHPRKHQVPADSAADAKRQVRESYEREAIAFKKMTAKKVW